MGKPKILVTGASGNTGLPLVIKLREEGWPVRALVHARDPRAAALERAGAEVVVADLFDVEQLTAAARGTQRAYFVPVYHPNMVDTAVAFAAAVRAARIEVVVGLSQWLASPSHPSLLTRQHWLVDEMLSSLPGVGYVRLNPGYFADNYLRFVDLASLAGVLPSFTGESRNAPPSNEDIARVAAALLVRPDAHVGKAYRPTGPRLVTSRDVAEVLGRVLRRSVRAVPMPRWIFAKAARHQGVSAYTFANFMTYNVDHAQGAFELGAPNDVVRQLTGQPAEELEVTARRYAALPKARRTFANVARAWLELLVTPFFPGYDPAALQATFGAPARAEPRFAMQNEAWRSARAVGAGSRGEPALTA